VKENHLLFRSSSWLQARRRLVAAACSLSAAMVLLAGCGPVKLVASTNIPPPLIVKLPITVALFMPPEFSTYVHQEERWSTKWHVELGQAQTDGISRLMDAMFERVVRVDSVNAGTQVPGGVAAILEPSIEEYAFVTPRDAGSPFYAVSIKYRVNVYLPDGKLADSWGFTGYGTAPSQGLSSEAPLSTATALAMRDAGAKLAVEFREQAVMRSLLPESETADSPPAPSGAAGEAPGAQPQDGQKQDNESQAAPTSSERSDGQANAPGEAATAAPSSSDPGNEVPEDSPGDHPGNDPGDNQAQPATSKQPPEPEALRQSGPQSTTNS
jgi:hypothetical protein